MRRMALFALNLLAFTAGEAAHAESRYSLRGLGETVPVMRADTRAMGGAETASRVPSIGGNPASLSFARLTTFYGTYDTEWIRTEENRPIGVGVRKEYSGVVPNLALVFPLPGEFAFGTGLLVARRQGGTIERFASVADGTGGLTQYRQEFEGKGSLLRIPLLLAMDAGPVQIGSGLDLLLFSSRIDWRNDFSDADEVTGFQDSRDHDEVSLRGVAWRGGARVPVGDWLAFGASASVPSRLSGDQRLESDQGLGENVLDREADFHPTWALGFDARTTAHLRVAGDWVHESWDDADPLNAIDEFVNVNRFAVGLEWNAGGHDDPGGHPLRAGYRTELLHVRDAFGLEVRQHVVSAGSGFGIAGGRGDIDWYVEYGWRGEEGVTEYLENLVRFGVTITGWEKWNPRRKPDEDDDW